MMDEYFVRKIIIYAGYHLVVSLNCQDNVDDQACEQNSFPSFQVNVKVGIHGVKLKPSCET